MKGYKKQLWQLLEQQACQLREQSIIQLFEQNPERFQQFSLELPGMLMDFSKNLLTEAVLQQLIQLAELSEVEQWREKMFSGERINLTENRPVLHTALRNRSDRPVIVDGQNVMELVNHQLAKIGHFSEQVRNGGWRGFSGERITDVVCIGIGGSDLGPRMVTDALHSYADKKLRVHFVSNVDGREIADVLRVLDANKVLFVVSSKTFRTAETMTNAETARNWLMAAAFDQRAVSHHFLAVTANADAAVKFGIAPENIFDMWDWVGGRFSLWSAIGLPIALYIGFDRFEQLLEGAYEMDCHFRDAPLRENAPVLLALVGIWNSNFLGAQSQVVLPYDRSLAHFAAYLQQAEMESNGKNVHRDGEAVGYQTGPIIWGQLGIDGQHAFYQYLHQGSNIVPADFIGSVTASTPVAGHHENLMANFFAQSQALMCGVDYQSVAQELGQQGIQGEQLDQLIPHKVHHGNRPSNSLLMDQLDPRTLGALIALYEHKLFVQGVIWEICSFDQWGVELGKKLASRIQPQLGADSGLDGFDPSTGGLIRYFNRVSAGINGS